MAKFRSNHQKQEGNKTVVKVGIFGALVAGLFYIFNLFSGGSATTGDTEYMPTPDIEPTTKREVRALRNYLPAPKNGEVIHHPFYSLSYDETHEQAEWVAYQLFADSLRKPWLAREDSFREDPKVSTGSATLRDYRNSGYDRGHLVPSADMAYNKEAMVGTFLMSNMSPQARNFNKGIWRELEELTRGWAKRFKSLYIVSGPVLTLEPKGVIGDNDVTIPAAYFKVLLDLSEPELKGIAFIIPNEISYEPLFRYATSIAEVEKMTGIDFFADLLTEEEEALLENRFNIDLWEFNKSKFEQRVNQWNK